MKVEKLSAPAPKNDSFASLLRYLQPGEMLRVSTAQEWRKLIGSIHPVAKERGVTFETRNDGTTDVLIFIKESPKKV